MMFQRLNQTHGPRAVIFIRLLVGGVFMSEGIQKFLFASELGAGRFAKLGLPSPEILGPFVGAVEIACGALVILGLFTRLAIIPLLVVISVAIQTTKLATYSQNGFWKTLHEGRTDYAMLMCLIFLFIVGAGAWSADARLSKRINGS